MKRYSVNYVANNAIVTFFASDDRQEAILQARQRRIGSPESPGVWVWDEVTGLVVPDEQEVTR